MNYRRIIAFLLFLCVVLSLSSCSEKQDPEILKMFQDSKEYGTITHRDPENYDYDTYRTKNYSKVVFVAPELGFDNLTVHSYEDFVLAIEAFLNKVNSYSIALDITVDSPYSMKHLDSLLHPYGAQCGFLGESDAQYEVLLSYDRFEFFKTLLNAKYVKMVQIEPAQPKHPGYSECS